MRVGIIGASGYTGAELLRLAASHPELEVVLATGDTQAGTAVADLYPSLAAAYPDLVFAALRRRRPSTASTWCSAACPTAPRQAHRARSCSDRVRRRRRPGRRLPAEGPRRSTRSGTARSTPPPSCWPSSPTACPSCSATSWSAPPHVADARLLPDRGLAGPGPAGAGRAGRDRPASSSTPPAACPAPAGRPSPPPRSARSTRTSPPTACSTTATRPRSSRRSAPQVLFTPHLAPMNRGILATCYARPTGAHDHRRGAARRSTATSTPTSRSWSSSRARRPPRPRSAPTPPTSPPGSTSAPAGSLAIARHRQPGQGRLGPGGPVRQPPPRPPRDRPGLAIVGVYP